MTRVAAIDCGTNTIRLIVADLESGPDGRTRLAQVHRDSRIVRLGLGVDRTGLLDPQALARTLETVREYAAACARLGVDLAAGHGRFVATSATRDAGNRGEFVDGVRALLGLEPEVVSGQEEARLSFAGSLLGAQDRAPAPGPGLVVDLGGGSTELILGDTAPLSAVSLDTGSVRVSERHLVDGVTPQAEAAARAEVRALLAQGAATVDLGRASALVGLAGTITTVTAHALGLEDFDPEALDGAEISTDRALASCEAIVHSTPAQRESWGYLLPGRRDVIAAGALVWSEVITQVVQATAAGEHPVTTTVTSLHDILDGIALSVGERI
ncbi:MAG: exopolyphosphatase [Actinomyces sp.]|uniref:Ppx/GppA phosphatase family protein n=1 Tax=Actinomyces sp. TaxID=29317 RepID=UPI0026DD97CD|nr:exopolyphosphatase [Actinomyces sp.]MDO4243209.1 exopolyphosphatase [Actinomyces sp.]